MKKIELDSFKTKYLSEYLKETDSFVRKALDSTFIAELPVSSRAKTIREACGEFTTKDDIVDKKAALRRWIEISASSSQVQTVYEFIPGRDDNYIDEKIMVIRKMAELFNKKCGL